MAHIPSSPNFQTEFTRIHGVDPRSAFQDAAPPGGFPRIRYGRSSNVRQHGIYIGILIGSAIWGLWRTLRFNQISRHLYFESRFALETMTPFLQAEADVKFTAWRLQKEAEEAEIMSEYPGWHVGESVYHSKRRWVPPTSTF